MEENPSTKKPLIDTAMQWVDPEAEFSIEEYAEHYGQNFNEVGLPDFSLAFKKIAAGGKGVLRFFSGHKEIK